MEKDVLSTILNEEQMILERLATARNEAAERLTKLRREADAEFAHEEEQLAAAMQEGLAAGRMEAEQRAADLVSAATLLAERLHRLDDRRLLAITRKHLDAILPGRNNDRQNVEN